jgi:hypothetical protein
MDAQRIDRIADLPRQRPTVSKLTRAMAGMTMARTPARPRRQRLGTGAEFSGVEMTVRIDPHVLAGLAKIGNPAHGERFRMTTYATGIAPLPVRLASPEAHYYFYSNSGRPGARDGSLPSKPACSH